MGQASQYGVPDYMQYQTPQPVQQQPQSSPILGALLKGGLRSQRSDKPSMLREAVNGWLRGPQGDGVTVPGEGVGEGVSGAAQLSGQGTDMVSSPAFDAGAGMAPSLQAAGAGAEGYVGDAASRSAGGFLNGSGGATEGMGDGLGSGLQTTAGEGGLSTSGSTGIGYSPVSEGGTGSGTINGSDVGSGGDWASMVAGAHAGRMQGVQNYNNDPNMSNKKDGFGTHHTDYRAGVGGGVVGGLAGYYGGGLGAAAAGPVVQAIHPAMEKFTRGLINTGDSVGDSAGAMTLDPIGTWASGKYSEDQIVKDLMKYSLLGGLAKFIK